MMSDNSKNKLLDIESKLSAKFDPAKRVVMFDSRYYDVRHHIVNRKLNKYTSGDCVSIAGLEVNSERLLESLLHNSQTANDDSTHSSIYGRLCEQLRSQKRGVIHIYEIHKLSRESIQLLSQLIRYCKKHSLNWRVVLSGNMSWIDKKRFLPLNIDYLYAPKEVAYGSSKELGTTQRQAPGKSLSRLAELKPSSVLIALGVLLAVGFILVKTDQIRPAVNTEPDLSITTTKKTIESDISLQDPEVDDYLAMLERKEHSFNRQLEQFTASSLTTDQESGTREASKPETTRTKPLTTRKNTKTLARKQLSSSNVKKNPAVKMGKQIVAALKQFDIDTLTTLYDQGEPLNGVDDQGQSALTYAVLSSHKELTSYLIKAGITVNTKDAQGHTALFYAAVIGNVDAAVELLRHGAHVNATSNLLKTPLMAATHNGHEKIVNTLLKAGAEVNQQDHSGWTPLFFATWNNNVQLVQRLVNAGANKSHTDNDGYTVNDIAKLRGNQMLAKVLAK